MNATIPVNGHKYRVGKLNVMEQFHVGRKLGPLLATLGLSLATLQASVDFDLNDFAPVMGHVSKLLAEMPQADADYIIFTCLSVVSREQPGATRAAPVCVEGQMMFADFDLPTMMRLVVEVLKDNLGNFLKEPSGETNSLGS